MPEALRYLEKLIEEKYGDIQLRYTEVASQITQLRDSLIRNLASCNKNNVSQKITKKK